MKNLPEDIIRMAVISYNTKYLTRFEVLSALLLKKQVYWEMTLQHWQTSSDVSHKGSVCL
jgi:hypothetical protein